MLWTKGYRGFTSQVDFACKVENCVICSSSMLTTADGETYHKLHATRVGKEVASAAVEGRIPFWLRHGGLELRATWRLVTVAKSDVSGLRYRPALQIRVRADSKRVEGAAVVVDRWIGVDWTPALVRERTAWAWREAMKQLRNEMKKGYVRKRRRARRVG